MNTKKEWSAPVLQSLDMRSTGSKLGGVDESGHRTCGPAKGSGAQDNCS